MINLWTNEYTILITHDLISFGDFSLMLIFKKKKQRFRGTASAECGVQQRAGAVDSAAGFLTGVKQIIRGFSKLR